MQKKNIFSFSNEFIKNHYYSGYQKENWIQKEFKNDFIIINLEDYHIKLRNAIIDILLDKKIIQHTISLENLHFYLSNELKTYGNDGISKISTLFYETNESFTKIFHKFIYNILYKKITKKPFLFQSTPTFRIHCPSSLNSEFFPHFHTDLALGHPPYEINLWIPLTQKLDGHGFYLAHLKTSREIAKYINYNLPSLMDKKLFRDPNYLNFCYSKLFPTEVECGEALMFDGRCFHTAMPIQNHTRISIDFRIVLKEDFDQAEIIYENHGIRRQVPLLPESYYHNKMSDELIDYN